MYPSLFNPAANPVIRFQLDMLAIYFGMAGAACRAYKSPEAAMPGLGFDAVRQWNSGLVDLTYDTIKSGLGLDQPHQSPEKPVKLDI